MKDKQVEVLERALAREKAARKAAEQILEEKSRELYFKSQELEKLNTKLEFLVRQKTSQLKGVFENIVDAYAVMNLVGDVLKMNEAAENLLGYTLEDGINLMQLVHPEEQEKVAKAFTGLIEDGAVTDFQVRIIIADKSERLVHINASLIYDENESPIAAQGIVRDITELKNLEIQKENLLKKLEKSNEELQEYAHIVSHDLKSPLRSIDALVSWLKEDNKGKLDEVSEQNLTLIQSTLEKMELLISDVLNYSSVSADNTITEEVDLHSLVLDLVPILFVPEHIEIKILTELPTVLGDKTKLQQVFQNLISNAIKFNDKSKGFVQIDVVDQESHYRFSIKDNGIGIEPKFQDKVFKIFNTLNKREDSTGIGLSIVKKIVNLHEGEIWIESNLGEGATFFFTLKK
jgi:PAS domain S-box-containing protein